MLKNGLNIVPNSILNYQAKIMANQQSSYQQMRFIIYGSEICNITSQVLKIGGGGIMKLKKFENS